jgi:hypothetical protein
VGGGVSGTCCVNEGDDKQQSTKRGSRRNDGGNDCDSGDNRSGDNGGGDDGSCGDGDGNTDSGSGGFDGDSDGGNCGSNSIAVAMVKAMAAATGAKRAATAMAGCTDNNQLKGAWKK